MPTGYFGYGYYLPSLVVPSQSDLMAAVVAQLRATPGVVAAFGDAGPGAGAKFFADSTFTQAALPYLVYSEPDEEPLRVFGGTVIGQGSFELGVFDTTKVGARQKLLLVRAAVNGMNVPANVGEGQLVWVRNEDNRSEEITTPAPTAPAPNGQPANPPVVFEFGRKMLFHYKIVRSDP